MSAMIIKKKAEIYLLLNFCKNVAIGVYSNILFLYRSTSVAPWFFEKPKNFIIKGYAKSQMHATKSVQLSFKYCNIMSRETFFLTAISGGTHASKYSFPPTSRWGHTWDYIQRIHVTSHTKCLCKFIASHIEKS